MEMKLYELTNEIKFLKEEKIIIEENFQKLEFVILYILEII